MKIIKDSERQMNIHPLMVYFYLSMSLTRQFCHAIRLLNKYTSFTRGLFKFQVVTQIGRYAKSVLSDDLQEAMWRSNVMVRLMDDTEGNYYYALHQVNFNQPPHLVEASIREFIAEVCNQNLIHLNQRLRSISNSSEETPDSQDNSEGMPTRREAIEKMQIAFRQATEMRHFRSGVWDSLLNESVPIRPTPSSNREKTIPPKAVERLTKEGFTEDQAKIAASVLWDLLVSELKLPNKATSDEIALGAVDWHHSSYITQEQRKRLKPTKEPSIQVEIKRVVTRVLKNGGEKRSWGVEIYVNGNAFPINFGSKDRTMLYICTLLREKLGERLYIHEFYNNSKGRKSRFSRTRSRAWLKSAFNELFPSMDRSFDEWIEKIETAKGRPLNQGKTQATKLIEDTLTEPQPDGIYYCILRTQEDEAGDSYYHIKVKPENIIVPQELSYLVDEFYEMTNTQPVSDNYTME
ncbi:MAG: hypothetical protein IKG99_09180 [Bacteroidaceae bacterium]|nr:hypothetical protein [Bacteroidaceae bacterium]